MKVPFAPVLFSLFLSIIKKEIHVNNICKETFFSELYFTAGKEMLKLFLPKVKSHKMKLQ